MCSEIANTFKGQSVFITGATGFVGKALVEKLLRSCPEVKHIYILIRSKRGQDVSTRFDEVLNDMVFHRLKKSNPKCLEKVVAIEGDISCPGFSINPNDLETLIRDVSVVFHSAATVKFNEVLRIAVNINILGTRRVIELCRKLPELKVSFRII